MRLKDAIERSESNIHVVTSMRRTVVRLIKSCVS